MARVLQWLGAAVALAAGCNLAIGLREGILDASSGAGGATATATTALTTATGGAGGRGGAGGAPSCTATALTAIALGGDHSCALTNCDTVYCWGSNLNGEIGIGSMDKAPHQTPVLIGGLPQVQAIALGQDHTCALTLSGEAWCWGRNDFGQVAQSSASLPVTVPAKVMFPTAETVKQVAAGGAHTCALTSDAQAPIWCWGENKYGQLGITSNGMAQANPVKMSNPPPHPPMGNPPSIMKIALGYEYSCAQLSDGSMQCWGSNSAGQLGQDPNLTSSSSDPVTPGGNTPVVAKDISLGLDATCVAISQDPQGNASCWGDYPFSNSMVVKSYKPTDVVGGSFEQIATGYHHACLLSDGTAFCWGEDDVGQAGQPGNPQTPLGPTKVILMSKAATIASGKRHSCALLDDNTVWCWGANDKGQLGASAQSDPNCSDNIPCSKTPIRVMDLLP